MKGEELIPEGCEGFSNGDNWLMDICELPELINMEGLENGDEYCVQLAEDKGEYFCFEGEEAYCVGDCSCDKKTCENYKEGYTFTKDLWFRVIDADKEEIEIFKVENNE